MRAGRAFAHEIEILAVRNFVLADAEAGNIYLMLGRTRYPNRIHRAFVRASLTPGAISIIGFAQDPGLRGMNHGAAADAFWS